MTRQLIKHAKFFWMSREKYSSDFSASKKSELNVIDWQVFYIDWLPCLENNSYASLLHTNAAPPVNLKGFLPLSTLHIPKYALGKGNEFPTQRRSQQRNLSSATDNILQDWWTSSGIVVGPKANAPDQVEKAKRIIYTWKNCFAESVKDVRATDLLEHSIDLTKDTRQVTGKVQ